jgi:hypothetical protein
MTNSMWRVLDGEGNEQGPYSFQDLQGFYTTGNINHETMIWTDGLEEWVKAGRVEGLLPDVPQAVALAPAPSAQVAPVQAAPVGGMNLNPQISGITTPALGATQGKSLPGWICWSTILIGLLSLILYFLPWASVSCDQKAFGKEGRIDVLSQTGFQSTTKKYSLNVEFIKLRLLMGGIPKDKVNLAAEKEVEETIARDESNDKLERSTLALITLILAAVGLILAFIAYAVQGRFLLLGAQVLFVAGALLLSIQISKQFPLINAMMEVQERGMRGAIAAGAYAAENEAAKLIKEQEKKDEEKGEGESEAEKGDEDVVGNDEGEAPDGEEEENLAEDKEEGVAENEEEKLVKKAVESTAQKEKEIAKPMEEFSDAFQSKIEASCYIVVVLLGLSLLLLIIMMSTSKAPPAAVPQLGATTAQPQVGGFRLQ